MRRFGTILVVLLATACGQQDLTLLSEAELPEEVYGPPQPAPEPEQIPANGRIFQVEKGHLVPVDVTLQPVADSLAEALLVALLLPSPQDTGSTNHGPLHVRDRKVRRCSAEAGGAQSRAAPYALSPQDLTVL